MPSLLRPVSAVLLGLAASSSGPGAATAGAQEGDPSEARARVASTLAEAGLRFDAEAGVVSMPARVLVKYDLLEYLLVSPNGKAHESLFVTDVRPSLLNAALLALGVERGTNARYVEAGETDGTGGAEDDPEGAAATPVAPRILPPEGDGFFLYVAWREAGEVFFFRVDDLISNLETGRSMRRHRWVYLGSRFRALADGEPEVFLADYEGNLINLTFFFQGNTLLSAALPECADQTIWVANPWLLPERDAPVELVFSREPLDRLPPGWAEELVPVESAAAPGGADGDR